MNFLIVAHVPHFKDRSRYSAYAPYVNEMNVWAKHVEKLVIIAPLAVGTKSVIDSAYDHPNIQFIAIENFNFLTVRNAIRATIELPQISWEMYKAMHDCDHIHLRCPGNMGLIGCFIQMLFPSKTKTAKYAGNWDPSSRQPWTYKLQSWLLSNRFLTRNMTVLVYGDWNSTLANIKSFFTATYSQNEIVPMRSQIENNSFQFIFVGALVKGKNPLYAIKLVERLRENGTAAYLKLYGEGIERANLESYIAKHQLHFFVSLEGNQSRETLKQAYQDSQFVLLPSDSEGWPKAIAEGMFWGCAPIVTAVSCVPYMLDYGKRGVLLEMDLEKDILQIANLLTDLAEIQNMRNQASNWSRQYTLERFETEIKSLLH
ncbi:MAG: glycosyltransferase involved in cell wall biosynthesis [Flavobacteriales bacterium]|jgi:glycosyltransferase involved in cell wall biosynthesis